VPNPLYHKGFGTFVFLEQILMKKTILYSLGILTAFTLVLGNANTPKETQVSSEEVVQYSHGHTGG
jgi:hypothetical protein